MKTRPLVLLAITIATGCAAAPPAAPAPVRPSGSAAARDAAVSPAVTRPAWASAYPTARVETTTDTLFGTQVRDPYRWLEDAKSPDVQAWMRAEDTLTRARLAASPVRDAIAARLKELVYVDGQNVPVVRGTRLFYARRSGAQEKWVEYWREGKQGPEHVLLDPNTWSKDGSVSLHVSVPSWDGKRVAYTVSENNSDESTLHVIDVGTGKVSTADVIPGAKYASPSWTPKGDGFYYVRVPVDPKIPDDARPGWAELRFHRVGDDPAKDALVHEKTGDPSTSLSGFVSRDGRWLFAEVSRGWSATDIYVRDLRARPEVAGAAWVPLVTGKDARFDVTAFRDRFYVFTNDGAPSGRVLVADPMHLARDAWTEIIPERKDATLTSVDVVGGALALAYLKDATSRLEIHDLTGKPVRAVTLPGLGSASALVGTDDADEAYYGYESFDRAPEIHVTSVKRGGDGTWFAQKVPFDPSPYEVEQIFFASKDGTRVPMFVVHARSAKRDGQAPLLLTGYGGFTVSETPTFTASIVPWLERGGVYADVNLRGGGEYGEAWHRAGMKHLKQNVFDDFVAAAETLVKDKLTSRDRLVIAGGSNGGLLVGAAVTQRPDLFRAAVCGVPLLDMVRYHLFGSGRTWSDEYGTAENEEDFRALLAYSPYHHVTAGAAYPSILFESSDSDDRVDPMHARKMAAALQAESTGGPVLVRIEQHAGHGGADMYRAWVDRVADRYAFVLAEIARPGSIMGGSPR